MMRAVVVSKKFSEMKLIEVVGPEEAAELTRIANDEMAEMVAKYPLLR